MKKLLLTLGSAAAVITPLATVVACGGNNGGSYTPPKEPYDFLGEYNIVTLDSDIVNANEGRYIDFENKMLLWNNIEADGYSRLDFHRSDFNAQEDWLINTDMDIPEWLYSSEEAFGDSEFNNTIHIPSKQINWSHELLLTDVNVQEDRTAWAGYTFTDSTINNGIVFEDDLKVMINGLLLGATVYKSGEPDYKITLPSTIEKIGGGAFSDVRTDVIDYDFSHLTEWLINQDHHHPIYGNYLTTYWMFGSERGMLKDKVITLPSLEDSYFDEGLTHRPIIDWGDDSTEAPVLIQYNSSYDWDYTMRDIFTSAPDQVGWSNIY